MVRFIVTNDFDELSEKAAILFLKQINKKDNSLLGLATGSTPIGIYQNWIRWNQAGMVDFSAVRTVSLDEYVGLPETHEQSYRYFMNDQLFNHVNIDIKNTYVPNGTAQDMDKKTKEYEQCIDMLGGVDIQLLGIGRNGHIGFNEPSSSFASKTHIVDLDDNTRDANARFFSSKDEVPMQAVTMGVGTIMKAKKIVLVANGEEKADALYKAFFEDVTPKVPASILQYHVDVTVVADIPAMSKAKENQVHFSQAV